LTIRLGIPGCAHSNAGTDFSQFMCPLEGMKDSLKLDNVHGDRRKVFHELFSMRGPLMARGGGSLRRKKFGSNLGSSRRTMDAVDTTSIVRSIRFRHKIPAGTLEMKETR
jgi:hypothetical protein